MALLGDEHHTLHQPCLHGHRRLGAWPKHPMPDSIDGNEY
jgi:hypothetical protein